MWKWLKWLCLGALTAASAQIWEPEGPGPHPLILLSHGHKGNPETLSWLAESLAAEGFIVTAPLHNDSAGKQLRRPSDILAALDEALASDLHIDEGRIGMAGFSLGATTGLYVGKDPRVRALFLMAPALPILFSDKYLGGLDLPVELVVGEADTVTPRVPWFAERLPRASLTVLPGDVSHYVFLTPRSDVEEHLQHLYTDPEGIDRVEIQKKTSQQAISFFRTQL